MQGLFRTASSVNAAHQPVPLRHAMPNTELRATPAPSRQRTPTPAHESGTDDDTHSRPRRQSAAQRGHARPAAGLAARPDWGVYTSRPQVVATEPGAPGPPAPGMPAGRPTVVPFIIEPPVLHFSIHPHTFYILPDSDAGLTQTGMGFWLVPHRVDATTSTFHPFPRPQIRAMPDGRLNPALFDHPPNLTTTQYNRDVIVADPLTDFTIGERHLRELGEKAEAADYAFALRMQGLLNTNLRAVWVSLDPEVDAADRARLADRVAQDYTHRLLEGTEQTDTERGQGVICEAVYLQGCVSEEWYAQHKHTLSPSITACSESLVGLFFNSILRQYGQGGLTWGHVARVLRRDPRISPQFGLCLSYYMTKMEQDRGSRNASYKSMFNASSSNLLAINSMDTFLRANKAYLDTLITPFLDPVPTPYIELRRALEPLLMDWYAIVTQLPPRRRPFQYRRPAVAV